MVKIYLNATWKGMKMGALIQGCCTFGTSEVIKPTYLEAGTYLGTAHKLTLFHYPHENSSPTYLFGLAALANTVHV